MRLDGLVEGPLHVEHHGVQAAVGLPVPVGQRHRPRGVVQRGQAHRLGQPARRIDRQHHHMPAAFGGPDTQRGRRRRLAHPAGTAADDDAGPRVVEQPVDLEAVRAQLHFPERA
jgi:hypothetical protein